MERNVNKPVSVNWYFHCGVMEEIIFSADCFQLTNQQTDLKTGFFSINTWCRFCYSVASSKLLFYFFIVSCYHNMPTTTLRALDNIMISNTRAVSNIPPLRILYHITFWGRGIDLTLFILLVVFTFELHSMITSRVYILATSTLSPRVKKCDETRAEVKLAANFICLSNPLSPLKNQIIARWLALW